MSRRRYTGAGIYPRRLYTVPAYFRLLRHRADRSYKYSRRGSSSQGTVRKKRWTLEDPQEWNILFARNADSGAKIDWISWWERNRGTSKFFCRERIWVQWVSCYTTNINVWIYRTIWSKHQFTYSNIVSRCHHVFGVQDQPKTCSNVFFRSLQDPIEKDTRFSDKNTGGVFVEY